jgi:hypothetical protein
MTKNIRDNAGGRAYLDLQNRARRERRPTQEYLTAYVIERWLSRLGRSAFVNDFVLKGGVLLAALGERRPTADGDALARNMANDAETVAARITDIASIADGEDGVVFVTDSTSTRLIRDGALYHGVRVAMDAHIGTAKVKLRLDINFGDPVTPAPRLVEVPLLRVGMEPVRVLGYPIETVLAEKLVTAIELGAGNTRVRDYADIYTLTGTHELDYGLMRQAIEATADFRGMVLRPLSDAVGDLVTSRATTYNAYRERLGQFGHHLPHDFAEVVAAAIEFVDALIDTGPDDRCWTPNGRHWLIGCSRRLS